MTTQPPTPYQGEIDMDSLVQKRAAKNHTSTLPTVGYEQWPEICGKLRPPFTSVEKFLIVGYNCNELVRRADVEALIEKLIGGAQIPPSNEGAVGLDLSWSEPAGPNDECMYDHVIATTPFGRFLLTWKGGKKTPSYSFDETPWDHEGLTPHVWRMLESAKMWAAAEMARRLALVLTASEMPELQPKTVD